MQVGAGVVDFAGLVADEQLIPVPDVVGVYWWGGLILVVGVGIGKDGGLGFGAGSLWVLASLGVGRILVVVAFARWAGSYNSN